MPRSRRPEARVRDAAAAPGGPLPGLDDLDKLLEHRVRLAVCVLLERHDALTFRRLKDVTGETDGSLGAQLGKLEEAGYVRVRKKIEGRRPVSWYRLAPAGRAALRTHLRALEQLLDGLGRE